MTEFNLSEKITSIANLGYWIKKENVKEFIKIYSITLKSKSEFNECGERMVTLKEAIDELENLAGDKLK